MAKRFRMAAAILGASALFIGAGCDRLPTSEPAPPATSAHEDLLMGYELLSDTLSDESRLGGLKLLKTVTFSGPVEEVGEAMDTLAEASKRRKNELDELRKLAPDVTAEPATRSPIGDAITAVAKDIGTDEMLDGEGSFSLRFVVLQAQATRMVSAMASAIAEHEPNADRQKWLRAVATEYEGYRDELIDVIVKYIQGKGDAQTSR